MKLLFFLATVAILGAVVYLVLRARRLSLLWRTRKADKHRSPTPRLPPERFETLVEELLDKRGWQLEERRDDGFRAASGPREARLLVAVEPAPSNDRVPADRVRELVSAARAEEQGGVLMTPYHIDRAGIDEHHEGIELIDGLAFANAVRAELPQHAEELRGYRFTGTERAFSIDRRGPHSSEDAMAVG